MNAWKGYDAWRTTDPRENDEHHPACPAGEDAPVIWSECDGEDECICFDRCPWGTRWFWRFLHVIKHGEEICQPITDPECKCAEITDDDAADSADAAEDMRRES